MDRKKLVKGDQFSVAFFHVTLPVVGQQRYELMDGDVLEFTIARRNRKPIVKLTYPGSIIRDAYDTYIVRMSADETRNFPCLLYEMQLTLNIRGEGKEVFTIVKQELEVVAK